MLGFVPQRQPTTVGFGINAFSVRSGVLNCWYFSEFLLLLSFGAVSTATAEKKSTEEQSGPERSEATQGVGSAVRWGVRRAGTDCGAVYFCGVLLGSESSKRQAPSPTDRFCGLQRKLRSQFMPINSEEVTVPLPVTRALSSVGATRTGNRD